MSMPQDSRSHLARLLLLTGALAACGGEHDGADPHNRADSGNYGEGGPEGPAPDGGVTDDAGPEAPVCAVSPALSAEVAQALTKGNATSVASADVLLDATLGLLDEQRVGFDADLVQLFQLNPDGSARSDGTSLTALNWNPTHDAALLRATLGANVEALVSNDRASGDDPPLERGLAVIGKHKATPYVAMAVNPFRTNMGDEGAALDGQMDQFLVNTLRWLAPNSAAGPFRVVLAQLDEGYWFPDESSTRSWLRGHFQDAVSFNEEDACDGAKLEACLAEKPDLLVVSQAFDEATQSPSAIAATVAQALRDGIPVLYFNVDGGVNALGTQLLALLQVENAGDNYWEKLRTTDLDGSARLGQLSADQRAIREMLTHLKSGAFGFTLAQAAEDQDLQAYRAEFAAGAGAVRSMMNAYDSRAQNLFAACGNEVPKLLALLGDRLRQDIVYPFTVANSSPQSFLRAYYADHAVYNARPVNPAQPDLGSFDAKDLSGVSATTRTLDLTSRRDFRSAGVYALPGRALKVTRLDSSATKVWVFVNSQRSGSTHEWEDDNYGGYARPKFLQSAQIPLAAGQTIVLTNPYGGPVQLRFDQSNVPVQLRFENVGEHPHWRGPADDASFAAKLAADTYGWVEVATAGFELHSSTEAFRDTMKDARWNTPATLAAAIERYTYNDVHVLAGFQGDGIDQLPEVFGWAQSKGLSVPVLDYVKHGNMDQPTCGYGCSGNPYDAGWSFSPIGHGDLHELGHSLQNGRFQLSHGQQTYGNHAVTNWSPFYAASRHFEEHGGKTTEWTVQHKQNFEELQEAYQAGDRSGSFSSRMNDYFAKLIEDDDNIGNCYSFFMQAMVVARHENALQNGYHIVPRIHMLDRAVHDALDTDESWTASRTKLGFSQYSRADAQAISNNDFIAVTLAFVTGLDYRDFMAMWGISVSAKAAEQIESYGFPAVARVFFALDPAAHAYGAMSTHVQDYARLPVDGSTPWPQP
jgi:hypothetical protein